MASATESGAGGRLLQALRESAALLDGHFLLSSGRHAARYVQCALLLQHPERAAAACADLAREVRAQAGERPCAAVVGPALGAVTLAYELARALGARALFAERSGASFALRRGFRVAAGEPVLVAEDVVTTGGSAAEVVSLLREAGGRVIGVAALVNRSGDARTFGALPFFRLLDLEVPSWSAGECPLCRAGAAPPVKLGSRPGGE